MSRSFDEMVSEHGRFYGDHMLQKLARLLDDFVRETDVATRCGGQEFVVVMQRQVWLAHVIFAQRFQQRLEEDMSISISGGIASALDGDNPRTLLARADAAIQSAKQEGDDLIFRHTGLRVEPIDVELSDLDDDDETMLLVDEKQTTGTLAIWNSGG